MNFYVPYFKTTPTNLIKASPKLSVKTSTAEMTKIETETTPTTMPTTTTQPRLG